MVEQVLQLYCATNGSIAINKRLIEQILSVLWQRLAHKYLAHKVVDIRGVNAVAAIMLYARETIAEN